MPAVFVHGVPDTPAIWQPLIGQLARRDVVTLALPGFGNKRPAGFVPDKDSYAQWLVDQLSRIDGPIDLVGHDWGALLVIRAVTLKPVSFRTWCTGGAPLDPNYVWHDTAQTLQTPGKGEQLMANFSGEPVVQRLMAQGQPEAMARATVGLVDDEMKSCILALYRSAVFVGRGAWYEGLKQITAPGLVLWGEKDAYATVKEGQTLALETRARFKLLAGCGHWYQAQDPAATASALEEHWAKAS